MKVYGETVFDLVYLLLAITLGITMLVRAKDKLGKLMGISTLILGCGDAFHLVPRVLDYFIDKDLSMYLGLGKLVTSISMTVFYIFMYYIYLRNYNIKENKKVTYSVWILSLVRITLCLFKDNNWLTNNSPLNWSIIRNIPFLILGMIIICLYFKVRKNDIDFKNMWIYVILSFMFYIPVVLFASSYPLTGMLMLPKTVCYILILLAFRKKEKNAAVR